MSRPIGYDDLRGETVVQVAKLMAAEAITVPKSGGQLFLAVGRNFMETVIVDDAATRGKLAEWMRARGAERRETIWFRDAQVAEAVDVIPFVGLLPDWYPPNYDCRACGYGTCREFLAAVEACEPTPQTSSSPGRCATCATSTSGSRSARRRRRRPCTRSTAGARPGWRWRRASSG